MSIYGECLQVVDRLYGDSDIPANCVGIVAVKAKHLDAFDEGKSVPYQCFIMPQVCDPGGVNIDLTKGCCVKTPFQGVAKMFA